MYVYDCLLPTTTAVTVVTHVPKLPVVRCFQGTSTGWTIIGRKHNGQAHGASVKVMFDA